MNLVKKEDFGYRNISTVKVSDAKQWFAKLQTKAWILRIYSI
ncbi:hypothetical protein [Anaerotruncus sp. 80]|nr:hypothetical protein [Anaerotruncus sp. 80]